MQRRACELGRGTKDGETETASMVAAACFSGSAGGDFGTAGPASSACLRLGSAFDCRAVWLLPDLAGLRPGAGSALDPRTAGEVACRDPCNSCGGSVVFAVPGLCSRYRRLPLDGRRTACRFRYTAACHL